MTRLTHTLRIASALLAAAACLAAVPGEVAQASQVGDESGVVTGTLDYTQPPPAPALGAPCGPVAWTLSAGGISVAADASTTGGSNGFAFAGSTSLTGTGTSTCATAADDLFGSLQLTATATGAPGLMRCSGSGAYTRAGSVLFSELAMSCTFNGSPLPPAVVAFAAALVPATTDLAHFTVAGAYSFGLSDINP